uniref:Uncharacterized protein n=1 Tax=Romanomermis culicivorax TaxID=13658 RepID=A0A915I2Z6_ROMCU
MLTFPSSTPAKEAGTDQTLPATAQSTSPAAATQSLVIEPMAVDETMPPVNDRVSIIEEPPFPTATARRSPKTSTQDIQCQQLHAWSTSGHHTTEQTTIKKGFIRRQPHEPFDHPPSHPKMTNHH